jgi:hypothetical protein
VHAANLTLIQRFGAVPNVKSFASPHVDNGFATFIIFFQKIEKGRFLLVFDRFRGLSRPEGTSFSFARSVQLMAFVWIVNCGIYLPQIIYSDTQVTTTPNGLETIVTCGSLLHMTEQSREVYWIIGRVLVFLVPLVITWVSYIGIYWKMVLARSKV